MLIEHNRANPLLNTRWIGSREIITFAVGAAVMRVLLSEQSFGAFGLLSAVGMGNDQLILYQGVITLATIAGLAVGLMTLNPLDLLRSEEHTSELQSLMRISYAVFCLKKTK